MKTVLLIDFGSAIEATSTRKYLERLFTDPYMVGLYDSPRIRKVTGWLSSHLFARRSKARFERIKHLVDPARERDELSRKIEERISVPVKWATRYAEPTIEEIVEALDRDGVRRITMIPLFPHESYAVTGSIISECERIKRSKGLACEFEFIKSWFEASSFARAWAEAINGIIGFSSMPLIFSAHAVPIDHVERHGCPYPEEIMRSAKAIIDEMKFDGSWLVAYQSRGPKGRWTEPSVQTALNKLINQGVKECAVVPLSFLFDNVETLVDLDLDLIPRYQERGLCINRVKPPGVCSEIVETLICHLVNKNEWR